MSGGLWDRWQFNFTSPYLAPTHENDPLKDSRCTTNSLGLHNRNVGRNIPSIACARNAYESYNSGKDKHSSQIDPSAPTDYTADYTTDYRESPQPAPQNPDSHSRNAAVRKQAGPCRMAIEIAPRGFMCLAGYIRPVKFKLSNIFH